MESHSVSRAPKSGNHRSSLDQVCYHGRSVSGHARRGVVFVKGLTLRPCPLGNERGADQAAAKASRSHKPPRPLRPCCGLSGLGLGTNGRRVPAQGTSRASQPDAPPVRVRAERDSRGLSNVYRTRVHVHSVNGWSIQSTQTAATSDDRVRGWRHAEPRRLPSQVGSQQGTVLSLAKQRPSPRCRDVWSPPSLADPRDRGVGGGSLSLRR